MLARLEVGLLEERLVLLAHHITLHLGPEVHRHDDDDQQGRATEIEGHVVLQHQELGQQTDQRDVDRPGQPIYVMLYTAAIVFFCFFYTALVFNSRETADNLKKSGAFIPGIRPGDQTAKHIDRILSRLTLAGAIYITAVCLLPEFLVLKYNVPFNFGGTSLLIIVVVTMDFWAQVQSYVMSQQYESLLKKANFKAT